MLLCVFELKILIVILNPSLFCAEFLCVFSVFGVKTSKIRPYIAIFFQTNNAELSKKVLFFFQVMNLKIIVV